MASPAPEHACFRLLRRAVAGSIGCVEPVLVTERLVLRRFTAADVDGLLALDGDPAVMRYMAVNVRSRAVLEKAGLRYARTVRLTWDEPLPGNEHGDVEYRLRRADWEPKRVARRL